jgi:hypothetical protein
MTSPKFKVQYLFSAPVLQLMWKDCEQLNQALRSIILEKREQLPSERMSNAGG